MTPANKELEKWFEMAREESPVATLDETWGRLSETIAFGHGPTGSVTSLFSKLNVWIISLSSLLTLTIIAMVIFNSQEGGYEVPQIIAPLDSFTENSPIEESKATIPNPPPSQSKEKQMPDYPTIGFTQNDLLPSKPKKTIMLPPLGEQTDTLEHLRMTTATPPEIF